MAFAFREILKEVNDFKNCFKLCQLQFQLNKSGFALKQSLKLFKPFKYFKVFANAHLSLNVRLKNGEKRLFCIFKLIHSQFYVKLVKGLLWESGQFQVITSNFFEMTTF